MDERVHGRTPSGLRFLHCDHCTLIIAVTIRCLSSFTALCLFLIIELDDIICGLTPAVLVCLCVLCSQCSSRALTAAKDHRSKGKNLTSACGAAYLAPDVEGRGGQVVNPEAHLHRDQPVQVVLPPRKRNPTKPFAHSEHMQTGRKRGSQSSCALLQTDFFYDLQLLQGSAPVKNLNTKHMTIFYSLFRSSRKKNKGFC